MGLTKTLIAVNAVLMGSLGLSFLRGPFSSFEQELWYRWGAVAFLVAGVALPLGIVLFAPKWARNLRGPINVWLLGALLGFCGYAASSGGGV